MLKDTIYRLFFKNKNKKQTWQFEKDESKNESDQELRLAKRFIRNHRKKLANLDLDYRTRSQVTLSSSHRNINGNKMHVSSFRQKQLEKERKRSNKPSYISKLLNLKGRKKTNENDLRSYLNSRTSYRNQIFSGHELENRKSRVFNCDHLNIDHLNNKHLVNSQPDNYRANGPSVKNRPSFIGQNTYYLDHSKQTSTNMFKYQQLIKELKELRCGRTLNERFELENNFERNFCNCQNRNHLKIGSNFSDQNTATTENRLSDCSEQSQTQENHRKFSVGPTDGPRIIQEGNLLPSFSDNRDSLDFNCRNFKSSLYNHSSSQPTSTTENEDNQSEEDDQYLDTYTVESANSDENPISNESFNKLIRKLTYSDPMRAKLLALCGQSDVLNFDLEFSKEKYPTIFNLDSGSFATIFLALDKENNFTVLKLIRTISKNVQSQLSQLSYSGTETFDEVYNEVMISQALSSLRKGQVNRARCFPRILYIKLVAGRVPDNFQIIAKDPSPDQSKCLTPEEFYKMAKQYSQAKYTAVNDRKKFLKQEPFRLFTDSPVEYAVIAMKYAGKPIWKRLLNRQLNAQQLFGIIQQLIFGLVCAEKQFDFEHRDLHVSNILIKRTRKPEVDFVIDNQTYKLPTLGYRCFIVDMTFSRLTISKQVFYKDLSEVLYTQMEGKTKSKKLKMLDMAYQLMHDEIGENPQQFKPRTNLNWLIYIMKVIKDCELFRYNNDLVSQLLSDYYRQARECDSLSELIDYIIERSDAL